MRVQVKSLILPQQTAQKQRTQMLNLKTSENDFQAEAWNVFSAAFTICPCCCSANRKKEQSFLKISLLNLLPRVQPRNSRWCGNAYMFFKVPEEEEPDWFNSTKVFEVRSLNKSDWDPWTPNRCLPQQKDSTSPHHPLSKALKTTWGELAQH